MSNWFIGGYSADMRGSAPGVVAMTSRDDGSLALDESFVIPLASPSFLSATRETLYAALEGEGALVAIDIETSAEIGRVDTGGSWPCHVGLYGEAIVVANYFDGSLGVVQAEPLALRTVIGSAGSGPHPAQDGPHAHSSVEIEVGIVVSADLGADRLHVHTLDGTKLERTASFELPPGTGPRDLALHESGLLFVLGEHSKTVLILDWRAGELVFVDSVGVPDAEDSDQAAALAISDAGFVYTLLRGSNRVAVLRPSHDGRSLSKVGSVSSEGNWPRHCAFDGRVLHVANQESGSVASFALGDDGIPVLIAPPTAVASPTYLLRA